MSSSLLALLFITLSQHLSQLPSLIQMIPPSPIDNSLGLAFISKRFQPKFNLSQLNHHPMNILKWLKIMAALPRLLKPRYKRRIIFNTRRLARLYTTASTHQVKISPYTASRGTSIFASSSASFFFFFHSFDPFSCRRSGLFIYFLIVAFYIVVLLVFFHPLPLAVVNLLGRHLRLWSICKEKDVSPPS